MKLKSILIMTMVAIMAIAGGAIAATTTTTINATLDTPGFAGGVNMTFGTAPACVSVAGAVTACAAMTAAQAVAFVTESQTGTGTGLAGGMPAQVVYNPNAYGVGLGGYTAGVGSQTGYALSQTLFGMCTVALVCPKFVPAAAAASAATIQGLIISEGGGNAADGGAGTVTTSTIPSGTGNFNQATFMTDIVGSMVTAGVINNNFSQKTTHHSVAANATGSADADFIDQRLSQVLGTVQTLAQSTTIGASGDGLAVDWEIGRAHV